MDPVIAAREALILACAANTFALIRLTVLGVFRRLPYLYTFVAVQFLEAVLAYVVPAQSRIYIAIYIAAEPLNWIIVILMVREIYRIAFADYPGLSSLARWASYLSAAIAVVLCLMLVSRFGAALVLGRSTLVSYIVFWELCVFFTLSVFIAAMLFLLSRYPIRLDYNLAIHIAIFTANFFGTFLILFVWTSAETREQLWRNTSFSIWSTCCFVAWGLLLRRPAANPSFRVRRVSPVEEERLLTQLALLNRILIRSARDRF